MKTFLAVTRCLSCKKVENRQINSARFHFKGAIWGLKVTEILVFSEFKFQSGKDYILHLGIIAESGGILKTKLLRQRTLDEIKRKLF